jgi:hypothetical protein
MKRFLNLHKTKKTRPPALEEITTTNPPYITNSPTIVAPFGLLYRLPMKVHSLYFHWDRETVESLLHGSKKVRNLLMAGL